MGAFDPDLSRISKLFADRDRVAPDLALTWRAAHTVELSCGGDVAHSYGLQLAVLTAARIAIRCFPGAVRITLAPGLADAPLLVWPWLSQKLGDALTEALGSNALMGPAEPTTSTIIFGNAPEMPEALRATFDGWIAKVGPASDVPRLPERDYFSVAGVLAGSLAMSEIFLSFAKINIEAGRRTVALSLWRPDLSVDDPAALGAPAGYLPAALWLLGLGHLGNAFLWTLATLPYPNPRAVEFVLNDFDIVEDANVETGIILTADDRERFKATALGGWLEARQFRARLVERRFDDAFRCRDEEPRLALCGFDSNPARRHLATARFLRVVDSGLGGTANNFDTLNLHTWPNPRTPDELWPELSAEDEEVRATEQKRAAEENPAYARLGRDICGRFDLAGKSIAVPFVGTTAASFVVAEAVRLLQGGPAYADLKLSLSIPNRRFARAAGEYRAEDCAGIKFVGIKAG